MNEVYNFLKNNTKVIALSGVAGSGKDFLARELFIKKHGFYNFSLAWHFKIECVVRGDATYEEVFETKPPRVRRILQILGTEQGRNVWGEEIWINTTFTWMEHYCKEWGIDKFVIPDVRFPNELEYIQKIGGKVYRVISDIKGRHMTDDAKNHPSELSLSDKDDVYDGKIYNSIQSTDWDRLSSQINSIVGDL